jgi:hypothetical protein
MGSSSTVVIRLVQRVWCQVMMTRRGKAVEGVLDVKVEELYWSAPRNTSSSPLHASYLKTNSSPGEPAEVFVVVPCPTLPGRGFLDATMEET